MSPRPTALSPVEIEVALSSLPGWSLRAGKLYRKFEFSDFLAALDFMNRAVGFIEEQNHHPEWLNVYNRVEVELITHEVQDRVGPALSKLDVALAKHLNALAL
ncbi:MAG TPA: 4a-hydroxytetrahydrobiopterin dehydratase [Bdellovibrionota bacterium]|jgi:4a-hydroxytetrahydrobiopterin dehydratase|nr:4a-hydroxytetrahydrobiopterin dehydratase [Bdellovibrionota bacterium]